MRRCIYLNVAATRVGERIAVVTNNDSRLFGAEALSAAGADVSDIRFARQTAPKTALRHETGVAIDGVLGAPICEGFSVNGRARAFDAVLLSGRLVAERASLWPGARQIALRRRPGGASSLVRPSRMSLSPARRTAHSRSTPRSPKAIARAAARAPRPTPPQAITPSPPTWPTADDGGRRWIDFQNDVTLKDVALAAREGFVSVEHLEALHHARHGDRPGQDLERQRPRRDGGDHRPARFPTSARPPTARRSRPCRCAVFAGKKRGATISPLKRLPLENEHRARGAQMREYGGWLRPAWYGAGDPDAAIQTEAANARKTVALVRRLLARQDRGHRTRRGKALRLSQLQQAVDAEARKDPLRLHAAGKRLRLRRRRDVAVGRRPLSRLLLLWPHAGDLSTARALAAGSFRHAQRLHP